MFDVFDIYMVKAIVIEYGLRAMIFANELFYHERYFLLNQLHLQKWWLDEFKEVSMGSDYLVTELKCF